MHFSPPSGPFLFLLSSPFLLFFQTHQMIHYCQVVSKGFPLLQVTVIIPSPACVFCIFCIFCFIGWWVSLAMKVIEKSMVLSQRIDNYRWKGLLCLGMESRNGWYHKVVFGMNVKRVRVVGISCYWCDYYSGKTVQTVYWSRRLTNFRLTSSSMSISSSLMISALNSASRSSNGFLSLASRIKGCWKDKIQSHIDDRLFEVISTLSNSWAEGRLFASFTRHCFKKSLNSRDHLFGWSNLGGSDFWILSSTLMGVISWKGGSIWANSMRVTPRLQMSTL